MELHFICLAAFLTISGGFIGYLADKEKERAQAAELLRQYVTLNQVPETEALLLVHFDKLSKDAVARALAISERDLADAKARKRPKAEISAKQYLVAMLQTALLAIECKNKPEACEPDNSGKSRPGSEGSTSSRTHR
jgi:hypothetical protein